MFCDLRTKFENHTAKSLEERKVNGDTDPLGVEKEWQGMVSGLAINGLNSARIPE